MFARLMRAHGTLMRELEARLIAEHRLTIRDFDTLLHLSREPERRMRRVDLADRLALTPSGVTRLLDGLTQAGLVEKASCSSDARLVRRPHDRRARAVRSRGGDERPHMP